MSLQVTSLNSGSNGNCYYVGNSDEAVLIDAGISCRETERRMNRLGLSMQKIKAIFISHEHSDHIKGVEALSKKYQLPVFITHATLQHSNLLIQEDLIQFISVYNSVIIGSLIITSFPKMHDASDPYSFMVECNTVKVGVFTDIGSPCRHVIKHFSQCHAAFLEANYDEQMLLNGSYPYHLKRRISSGLGHLSNMQALEVFLNHKASFMSHLFLSHLSQNNNCPKLVEELFTKNAKGVQIIIASRQAETPLYFIQKTISNTTGKKILATNVKQLALSF